MFAMFPNLFGKSEKENKIKKPLVPIKGRKLRIESLESREMLSINPLASPDLESETTAIYGSASIFAASAPVELVGETLTITQANLAEYDFSKVTKIENSTITADGVTLDFANCTELTNTILTAKNGGILKFPKVESYSGTTNNTRTWEATGNASRIEMPVLQVINQTSSLPSNYGTRINTRNGGVVDLSKLASAGYIIIDSQGSGSNVDISGMANLGASNSIDIRVTANGTVTVSNNITELRNLTVTNPTNLINFDITKITSVFGSTITFSDISPDLSSFATVSGSTITADGVTLDFVNCTELSSTSLAANNGGVIKFPKVENYSGTTNTTRIWEADGNGSRIEMPVLQTINQTSSLPSNYGTRINARSGGVVDLSKLATVGYFIVDSQGSGSNVDISGMANLGASNSIDIRVTANGTVTVSNNITELRNLTVTNPTNLINFDITKITSVFGSTITFSDISPDLSSFATVSGSTITADGVTLDFVNCTELTNTNLYAKNEGVIKFPKLQSYTTTKACTWEATGNGSQIIFDTLTSLQASSSYQFKVTGQSGGIVTFPKLTYLIRGNVSFNGGVEAPQLKANLAGGTISTDTVWDDTSKIYLLGTLTISAGKTLTIKEGVTVAGMSTVSKITVNGTLNIEGSLTNPVILTSMFDPQIPASVQMPDEVSEPKAGAWNGITVSGTNGIVNASHFEIKYATYGFDSTNGGTAILNNGVIQNNLYGLYCWSAGGKFIANNCVISNNIYGIFTRSDSRGHEYTNCTIADNSTGFHSGASTSTFVNCIVAWNYTGLDHWGDPPLITFANSIFYNPNGQDVVWQSNNPGKPDLTTDGNKVADPMFVSHKTGNYRLLANSPAIDAGKTVAGLPTDILGYPRFDDPNVDNTDGSITDIGAYERQSESSDIFDVAVNSVTVSATKLNPSDFLTVSWKAVNQGNADTVAGNTAIYLCQFPYASANDILLGYVKASDLIAPGASKEYQWTTRIPPAAAGTYYIMVRSNNDKVFAESDYKNNVSIAAATLNVQVPTLTLGTPVNGSVTAKEWSFYTFEVTDQNEVIFTIESTYAKSLNLYLRNEYAPTTDVYNLVASTDSSGNVVLRLLDPAPGEYYLGIYDSSASGTHSFSLSAVVPPLGIRELSNTVISANSVTSILVTGDSFTRDAQVKLVPSSGSAIVGTVEYIDAAHISVKFDGTQTTILDNTYMLEITDGQNTIQFDKPITVAPVANIDFQVKWTTPAVVRPGRVMTLQLEYVNKGTVDMAAPILRLTTGMPDFQWEIPSTDIWIAGESLEFLALSSTGEGILRPGEKVSLSLHLKVPLRTDFTRIKYDFDVSWQQLSAKTYNFDSSFQEFRDEDMTDAEFEKAVNTFKQKFGTTYGDLSELICHFWKEEQEQGTSQSKIDYISYISKAFDQCTPSVSGILAGSDGNSISNLTIWAKWTVGDESRFAMTVTDKNGYYELNRLPSNGPVTLSFLDTANILSQTTITMTNGNAVNHYDLTVASYGAVAGKVLGKSKEQLAEVSVMVVNDLSEIVAVGETDEFGNFLIENIPLGTYRIFAMNESLAWLQQEITVKSNETVETTFTPASSSLSGKIFVSGEASATAGSVVIYNVNNNDDPAFQYVALLAEIDLNGNYRFDSLLPGEYLIEINTESGTEFVNIAIGESSQSLNITIPAQTEFSGRVNFASSIPQDETICIAIVSEDESVQIFTDVDEEGNFSVGKISQGKYHIFVLSADGMLGEQDVTLNEAKQTIQIDSSHVFSVRLQIANALSASTTASVNAAASYTINQIKDEHAFFFNVESWVLSVPALCSHPNCQTKAYNDQIITESLKYENTYKNLVNRLGNEISVIEKAEDLVFKSKLGVGAASVAFTFQSIFSAIVGKKLKAAQAFVVGAVGTISGLVTEAALGNSPDWGYSMLSTVQEIKAGLIMHAVETEAAASAAKHVGTYMSFVGRLFSLASTLKQMGWFADKIEYGIKIINEYGTISVKTIGQIEELIEKIKSNNEKYKTSCNCEECCEDQPPTKCECEEVDENGALTRFCNCVPGSEMNCGCVDSPQPDPEDTSVYTSATPEDLFGPAGFDEPDTPEAEKVRYIQGDGDLNYRIDFWNKPDALVPTQDARIENVLDPEIFDLSTFQFTRIGFLDWDVQLQGGQVIQTRIDMRTKPDGTPSGFDVAVEVTGSIDLETGEIVWIFHCVDPWTGDQLEDPFAGFLPPFNPDTGYELGWVEYTVKLNENLPTDTKVQSQAFVEFDFAGDIMDHPAPIYGPWTNTIDADAPTSYVMPFESATATPSFGVTWTGSDFGSGIAYYDVFVSTDGGNYEKWLSHTTDTTAVFQGEANHTYTFFCIAYDNVGSAQTTTGNVQSITTIASSEQSRIVEINLNSNCTGFEIVFSDPMKIHEKITDGTIVNDMTITHSQIGTITFSASQFAYNAETKTLTWNAGTVLTPGEYDITFKHGKFQNTDGGTLLGGTGVNLPNRIPVLVFSEHLKTGRDTIAIGQYSVPYLFDYNGDGYLDLIVGEKIGADGKVRVYINQGTNQDPRYGDSFYVHENGSDLAIETDGCMGAYPRFMDFNGDGVTDLLVGTNDGKIYWFQNTGSNTDPIYGIKQSVTYGTTQTPINVGARAAFDVVDWNNDGKLDLVIGALDGKIYVFLNNSTSSQATFANPVTVQMDGHDLVVPSGRASVSIIDFNGDGRKDIVSGSSDGKLWYYENIGTDASPIFVSAMEIELNESVTDSASRTRPLVIDYNGDGILDLLIGDESGKIRFYEGTPGLGQVDPVIKYESDKTMFDYTFKLQKPVSVIRHNNLVVQEGCSTFLSGFESFDYHGKELSYHWDLNGDGIYETLGSSFWFSTLKINGKPGATHTVSLVVRNEFGFESDPMDVVLRIEDVVPNYTFETPPESDLVAGISSCWAFAAYDTVTDPIINWTIDWGDGSETIIHGGPRSYVDVFHNFHNPGEYTVTISTTDFDGITSTFAIGSYVIAEDTVSIETHPISVTKTVETPQIQNVEISPDFTEIEKFVPGESEAPVADFTVQQTTLANAVQTLPDGVSARFIWDVADTTAMQLRQMLDLDQRTTSENVSNATDYVWESGTTFEYDFDATDTEVEDFDFWNGAFEDDLLEFRLASI